MVVVREVHMTVRRTDRFNTNIIDLTTTTPRVHHQVKHTTELVQSYLGHELSIYDKIK